VEKGILKCLVVSFFLASASLFIAGCSDGVDRINIVEDKCGKCHKPDIVYLNKKSKAEWDRVVYGMKVRGLKISEADEKILMQELYNKLGSE